MAGGAGGAALVLVKDRVSDDEGRELRARELVDSAGTDVVWLVCEECDILDKVIVSSTVLHFQVTVSNAEPILERELMANVLNMMDIPDTVMASSNWRKSWTWSSRRETADGEEERDMADEKLKESVNQQVK